MLSKQLAFAGVLLLILAVFVSPVMANEINSATVNDNCTGYQITLEASSLTVGTTYTIFWAINIDGVERVKNDFYEFTATATTQTATLNRTWAQYQITLTGTNTFTGQAVLVDVTHNVVKNTVQISFSESTLSCPQFTCTIPPSGTAIPGAAVSWNKFNTVGSPDFVWIHAHIGTPSGISTTTVTTVQFTEVTFVLNGKTYALPDGFLIFDPAAPATPTTSFDSTFAPNGRWVTTLNPNDLSDEIFFDGNALLVDSNISGGGKATFNYTTLSTDNNLVFSWQWSAAVYTFWPGNNAAMILPYHHTLHAGTPLNTQVQKSLIQGPRGGGGSNFTGSWSGTGNGTCPN